MIELEPLFTIAEVAAHLKLASGEKGVYELTRQRAKNRLEAVRVGRELRVTASALRAFLDRARVGAVAPDDPALSTAGAAVSMAPRPRRGSPR